MSVSVLRLGAVLGTVEKSRFERIVIGSSYIESLIENNAGGDLSLAGSHQFCFAEVDRKALLQGNRARDNLQAMGLSFKFMVSGDHDIVGVARVVSSVSTSQSRQANI